MPTSLLQRSHNDGQIATPADNRGPAARIFRLTLPQGLLDKRAPCQSRRKYSTPCSGYQSGYHWRKVWRALCNDRLDRRSPFRETNNHPRRPPADRWLSGFKGAANYAGRAVPLALHVDYWDYIGWRDPYAQPSFAARQRELSGINHARTVYTPQVLLAGRDFRPGGAIDSALAKINGMPPRADLEVRMSSAANELRIDTSAKLRNPVANKDAAVYFAVYENGLASSVAAGENKGKLLKHDFVVREWAGPYAFAPDGSVSLSRAVAVRAAWKVPNLGVAAFVQDRSSGEILQALQLASCS